MIPREEHPKPQFMRTDWENLNGKWEFCFDAQDTGVSRELYKNNCRFDKKITVPFCYQSPLSGIGEKEFSRAVWYRRHITVSESHAKMLTYLHFGACDYKTTVYVNEVKAGTHTGGYVSFCFDITPFLKVGDNVITVLAEDDERNPLIPSGKQSERYESYGCMYTRTTGIWQTVWLEYVEKTHIAAIRMTPCLSGGTVTVEATLVGCGEFTVSASFMGKSMGKASLYSEGGHAVLTLSLTEIYPWELGKGGLYDLVLTYGNDTVNSYFGLRDIDYRDMKFYLNGKSVCQRLVLDQGFNPEGIYTAPSDAELMADIARSMAMGFNGARLHEKVFEERFLYHADRLGYMVWGEYPNWGLDISDPRALAAMLPEWLSEVERDYNHPSIVGWCPFNETCDRQYSASLATVYYATKAADHTRPCIDTSGFFHVITDIFDIHDYGQKPESFAARYKSLVTDGSFSDAFSSRQTYTPGTPFFVSEYGGIRWTDKEGWGYGDAPKTEEEFLARLRGLNDALLDNPKIFAFCYTQLTDVEQEQNGLYTYDRRPKFDPAVISPLFSRKAAVED